MIVEAAFSLAHIEFEPIDVDWRELGWESKTIGKLNSVGQLPIAVLPNGEVLSESVAILKYVHNQHSVSTLIPRDDDPKHDFFWRWLMFINANIYPIYSYLDIPERWIGDNEVAKNKLVETCGSQLESRFSTLENHSLQPYFIGEDMSAIDLYLWLMSYWEPRLPWFEKNAPKITATRLRVESRDEVIAVMRRHFPDNHPD